MQLMFEICAGGSGEPPAHKTFDAAGGVIGRGANCDWIIADPLRLISNHHALVSYRDGEYFLTDISSNGVGLSGSPERLCRGQARLVSEGDVYQLGAVEIRARLKGHFGQALAADAVIPDDAFLGLDPLCTLGLEQQRSDSSAELDALNSAMQALAQCVGRGTVEGDHLVLPQWAVSPVTQPVSAVLEAQHGFWVQFGAALGMPLDSLATHEREALAIKAAGLFRQTVEGLQQSLRTRDELNCELNLGWTSPVPRHHSPLNGSADTQPAVEALLAVDEPGQLSAQLAIADAYRDIQVHQLALVTACRATVRSALTAFAPGHLLLCFERDAKPSRFATDGAHWRAYQRHYQRQVDKDTLAAQLFRHDFCDAYAQQLRLISTLRGTYPG